MHSCLLVSDIVQQIHLHLSKRQSVRLARTCRAMFDPAMDAVWRDISSLEPLIACLPKALFQKNPKGVTKEGIRVWNFCRDPTQRDLSRYLDIYAHRIREFCFKFSGCRDMLDYDELCALTRLSIGKPCGIFAPNLLHYQWYPLTEVRVHSSLVFADELAKILQIFVPPLNLQSLRLCAEDFASNHVGQATRNLLLLGTQSLTSLDLGGLTSIECTLNTPGLKFPNIVELQLSHPSVAAVRAIATWPKLRVLNVSSPPDLRFEGEDELFAGFPSLEILASSYANTAALVHVLRFLGSENEVHTVRWGFSEEPSPNEAQWILDAVARHCNPSALKHLRLMAHNLTGDNMLYHGQEELDIDPGELDLSPLEPFHNLEVLIIELGVNVQVAAQCLKRVPFCWPRIRRLMLSTNFPDTFPPLVNHRDILDLAAALPSIHELGIRFDGCGILGTEDIPGQSQLRILRVGYSPIVSPSRVIRMLRGCFPELEVLGTPIFRPDEDEMNMVQSRWRLVRAHTLFPELVGSDSG